MKTRRQQAAEDALTISRRNTLENSDTIPIDLLIEILLRLPAKSIAKFRSVSKFWASTLSGTYFTELFITRSRSRPKILLSCVKDGELFFFSIPQVQKPEVIAANYLMRLPCTHYSKNLGSLGGSVCFTHIPKYKKTVPVICNPSTGQSLSLPNVKTKNVLVNSFLGFDPINKQFKLLSMTARDYGNIEGYRVLTLGARKLSWRKIECSIPHFYLRNNGICINGVIYYVAEANEAPDLICMICFDVRSEKFKVVNKAEEMALRCQSTLVNYKGNLGALLSEEFSEVTGETKCFELWVLVDVDNKHEWSKHVSISLPTLWKSIVGEARLFFVGLVGTDEIVLSPQFLDKPFCFYVYYYNMESNAIRRVEIQGMDAFQYCTRVHISLNHVEDVKLLQHI